MNNTTTISFRTDEDKRNELDNIAASMDRDRSYVINEAIGNYIELYRWQEERVQKGISATERGKTYSTEEIRARIAKRHAERLKRAAKAK